MKPSETPPAPSKRGGAREEAGKPPKVLKAVKYGSTRICKKCGRFVAKTHFHECGRPSSKRKAAPVARAPKPFKLPGMPPDLQ